MCDGSLRGSRSVCDRKIQISTAEGLPCHSTGHQAEISTSILPTKISSSATPGPHSYLKERREAEKSRDSHQGCGKKCEREFRNTGGEGLERNAGDPF